MKPPTPLEQEVRLLTGVMIKLIPPMCCFFSQTVNSSVCFKKDVSFTQNGKDAGHNSHTASFSYRSQYNFQIK